MKNTAPESVKNIVRRWKALAKSNDPVEAATARAMLAAWRDIRPSQRPSADLEDDRPPARYAHALVDLINDDEKHWTSESRFKTGHSCAHSSKSGTCLSVDVSRGLWYCSSCRHGGDAIMWLMAAQGLRRDQASMQLYRTYGFD
jgi:hypothetical protein